MCDFKQSLYPELYGSYFFRSNASLVIVINHSCSTSIFNHIHTPSGYIQNKSDVISDHEK